jgi:molybdopterin synthase catalytic subunit
MSETKNKIKTALVQGPISPESIAHSIAHHQNKTHIGGHYIFMGQVRADEIDGKKVTAIEFTAQENIANQVIHDIREEAFSKFDLSCMHIYHSLGTLAVGQICFFVFVSSAHREEPYKAVKFLVDNIKSRVPIFGKELFEDGSHLWKQNRAEL